MNYPSQRTLKAYQADRLKVLDTYRTDDDSKEKNLIGKLWAARSGGRCVFELVGKDDMQVRLETVLARTDR